VLIHACREISKAFSGRVSDSQRRCSKVETDLGVVKTGADNAADVSVPTSVKDLDDNYDDAWAVLRTKAPKVKETIDEETRVQDSYKNIRTNVVMAWTSPLLGPAVRF
jgi:hypothetical protein